MLGASAEPLFHARRGSRARIILALSVQLCMSCFVCGGPTTLMASRPVRHWTGTLPRSRMYDTTLPTGTTPVFFNTTQLRPGHVSKLPLPIFDGLTFSGSLQSSMVFQWFQYSKTATDFAAVTVAVAVAVA